MFGNWTLVLNRVSHEGQGVFHAAESILGWQIDTSKVESAVSILNLRYLNCANFDLFAF